VTRRGVLALLLAAAIYATAWLVGSRTLYPVAVGLAGAVAGGAAWVRTASRPASVVLREEHRRPIEGDVVRIDLTAQLRRGLPPPGLAVVQRVGRLGEHRAVLQVRGRRAHAQLALRAVRRGRYVFGQPAVAVEDPFGLARAEYPLEGGGALLVYPRLAELDSLFSESGRAGPGGRRLLLRRPAGFEVHGVRDYQQGESLRRVHWASTAKRGRLMVKDLAEAPRDELAVVLDAQAAAQNSDVFDVQVRAAGSILRAYTNRGRRALLVITGEVLDEVRVRSERDWPAAYDALAAAEASGSTPLAALLDDETGPVSRAVELVAVTAALTPLLVERLCRRAGGGRPTSLVLADARPASTAASRPHLLLLAAAGVTVAVVHPGDDLAAALGGRVAEAAVNA
jgi:uncharacterized protein (DUF58 family)